MEDDARRVRALTERLIAVPSAEPDPAAARRFADCLRSEVAPGLETGTWATPAGAPVVFVRLRRRSPRTALLLAHFDTVGVEEYAALRDPRGAAIAFDPRALRRRLLARSPDELPATVRADLEAERMEPGTWLFGRGALDMKSGIAAGLTALERLAADPDAPGALLLICPDEESQSTGMLAAVERLVAWRERERTTLSGALNLDYAEEPVAYEGVAGKQRIGLWVFGVPSHVGNPFGGVDAIQLAAAIVARVTTAGSMVEDESGSVPPVAMRLRDRKPQYDVQTALEADVELNVIRRGRSLATTLDRLRGEIAGAMESRAASMDLLRLRTGRTAEAPAAARVLGYPELVTAAPGSPSRYAGLGTGDRVRALVHDAGLAGPLVVYALLPPFYPAAAPRPGGLGDRLGPLLARAGVPLRPWYPFISDASYVSWRGVDPAELAAHLPELGDNYHLPIAAARALDLDVVTLGPWGRDAHGLYERVHAAHAFGILPALIAEAVRGMSRDPEEDA